MKKEAGQVEVDKLKKEISQLRKSTEKEMAGKRKIEKISTISQDTYYF